MIVTVVARREFVLPEIRLTGSSHRDLEEIGRLSTFRYEVFSDLWRVHLVDGEGQYVPMHRRTHFLGMYPGPIADVDDLVPVA